MKNSVHHNTGSSETPSQPDSAAPNRHRLKSIEIFSGAREVIIEHAGDEYRLRLTSQGKLILTK